MALYYEKSKQNNKPKLWSYPLYIESNPSNTKLVLYCEYIGDIYKELTLEDSEDHRIKRPTSLYDYIMTFYLL